MVIDSLLLISIYVTFDEKDMINIFAFCYFILFLFI